MDLVPSKICMSGSSSHVWPNAPERVPAWNSSTEFINPDHGTARVTQPTQSYIFFDWLFFAI